MQGLYENLHLLVAIHYQERIINNGLFEYNDWREYGKTDIRQLGKYIQDHISIEQVYGVIPSYEKFRVSFFEAYGMMDNSDAVDPYLNVDDMSQDEREEYENEVSNMEERRKTMWESILYTVSDGDLTKWDSILSMNAYYVMNFFTLKQKLIK
jgi:hypothetical protein